MFKIIYILETQLHTVHYHTPVPGRWDVTGINGNVMLLRFPIRQKTSQKIIRSLYTRPRKYSPSIFKAKNVWRSRSDQSRYSKSWSFRGDRIHSHSIPRPAERRYNSKQSGVGHLVTSFSSTKPPAHPQEGGVVIPETSINLHILTRLSARENCIESKCHVFLTVTLSDLRSSHECGWSQILQDVTTVIE